MTNGILLAGICSLLIGGTLGYLLGRFQASLMNEIRTLREKSREVPKPEPTKPQVTPGVYAEPKGVSNAVKNMQGAGIVETKSPERLEWENRKAIEDLGKL